MSFGKFLKCYLCCSCQPLKEENFPEDLYDLISQYKIDQLVWVCKICKKDLDQMRFPALDQKTTLSASSLLNKRGDVGDVIELDYAKKLKVFIPSGDQTEIYNCGKQEPCSVDTDDGSDTQSVASLKSLSLSESPKENKAARKYVHEILNKIKITRKEDTCSKQIIISVLDILITEMKKDEEFSCVYNKLYYTGSSYNDLRITAATEYDIDVVLHIPNSCNIMPDLFDKTFAFGKIKWDMNSNPNVSVSIKKFIEKNSVGNYLSPQMVLSWFQRHLDLVVKKMNIYPSDVCSVKTSSSGPARTIIIDTDLGYSISVDLVPVFEFGYSILSSTSIFGEIEKTMSDANKDKWFMVPKMCQGEIDDVSLVNAKLSWRLDFPNAEKHVLHGKECAKNVIKMLKIFRDNRNWKKLASYYLKVVVMLEIKKNPSSDYWKNGFVFERTLDALEQLKTYLLNQNLPHFLTSQNLLFKWKPDECINYGNYLSNMIPKIKSEPETIVKFFL